LIEIEKRKAVFTRKSGNAVYIKLGYDMQLLGIMNKIEKKYYHPYEKAYEIPLRNYNQLIKTFEGYEFVTTVVDKGTKELLDKQKTFNDVVNKFKDAEPNTDFEFKTEPYDHQVESFQYAMESTRFLLNDEQGLGKTKQAIDIAVNRQHEMKHCLIVCGVNGLKWNWEDEINTHSNATSRILGTRINRKGRTVQDGTKQKLKDLIEGRDEFFLITNIEALRSKEIQNILHEMTTCGDIGMVIIDEIHKCKSPTSQIGKAIHKLDSYYKIGMTGTPLLNNPIDLWNPLKWVGEHHNPLYRFKAKYCVFGGFGGYEIIGYRNLDDLQNRLNIVQLRRMKDEVLDLPPKIHSIEYVELGKKQAILYEQIKEELISQIKEIELNPNPLAKLIRLRQVTAHPAILDPDILESPKMERLEEMVGDIMLSGKKVIIFSNWKQVVSVATDVLVQHNPLVITGDTKDNVRPELIKKFQTMDDRNVIIGTIGAMGTGITLNKGSYVLFLDEPWSSGIKEQGEDRAHRIGTTGTVNVITFITKGTIDEDIMEIVEGKKDLAGYLVDGDVESRAKVVRRLLLM
jgi:SNF2 family DNA or RNA helicase